jgi:hypothetical protein
LRRSSAPVLSRRTKEAQLQHGRARALDLDFDATGQQQQHGVVPNVHAIEPLRRTCLKFGCVKGRCSLSEPEEYLPVCAANVDLVACDARQREDKAAAGWSEGDRLRRR